MRLLKASILAVAAVFMAALLALAVECPACKTKLPDGTKFCPACGTKLPVVATPEPKKPEPVKPEPVKPEPKKPSAKELARAKERKARDAYAAAERAWKADPKDHAAAIRRFEEAKKLAAGTGYERSCDKMIAKLKVLKTEAEERAKLEKARVAYEDALVFYKRNRADLDGALKKFEAAAKAGEGTGYGGKCAAMCARIKREKDKLAAARKPEPKKPEPVKPEPKKPPAEPISKFVSRAVGDVASPDAAFTRAQALEKAAGKTPRQRAEAALPYYYATVKLKKADGSRSENAGAAALRIGELLEKHASDADCLATASRYYLISSFLDLDSAGWRKAERLSLKAGQGKAFAPKLAQLAAKARAAGKEALAAELQAHADRLAR